jgi:hypothetical protein
MANIGKGRAVQVCDACGGVDDHPRHSIAGSVEGAHPPPTPDMLRRVMDAAPAGDEDRLIADLLDTGSTTRHLDCCRDAGCESCAEQLGDWDGKTGAAMLRHLTRGN